MKSRQDVFKVTARRTQSATPLPPVLSSPAPLDRKPSGEFVPGLARWLALAGLLILLPRISFALIHIGVALAVAAWLAPLVAFLVRRNVPRPFAIFLVLGATAAAMTGMLVWLYPFLAKDIATLAGLLETSEPQKLASKLSVLLLKVLPWLRTKGVLHQLEEGFAPMIAAFVQAALAFEVALLANLISYVMIALLVFYALQWGEPTKRKIVQTMPNRYLEGTVLFLENAVARCSRYLRVQTLLALTASLVLALAFHLMQLPGILAMAVYGALTLLTPYWGGFVGAIPVAVASMNATNSFNTAFGIVLAIATMQLLINVFLSFTRLGEFARLHPWEALLALLLGGSLGGVWGILLAGPLAALCKIILQEAFWVRRNFRG